jgi:DNA repair exonuclease SbcCD ATPase subunit
MGETSYRTKPIDSNGGGIVDMISIALRVAILEIHSDPRINGPIILDEPGKHVSEDYVEKMALFLKYLSSHFNRQIIMVTHQQSLSELSDKSFQVLINGGVSCVLES